MSKMYKDIMVDLETLSTNSNGLIVSVGLVSFDINTGELGETFHIKIDPLEQAINGAIVDTDTLEWWSKQSDVAKNQLCKGRPVSVKSALLAINSFMQRVSPITGSLRLWGNGAGFDNVLLRNLYDRAGVTFVVPYWCDCDVRTHVNFMKHAQKKEIKFDGVKHDPVDDCKHQIKLLIKARELQGIKPVEE